MLYKSLEDKAKNVKEWQQNNKEKVREYNRKSYLKHLEERRAHRREYYYSHKVQCNARRRKFYLALKTEVLTYYGNGQFACVVCGENRLPCLSIDHINGGGLKHCRSLGVSPGVQFYIWLKKQDYPEGYQTLCMNCQFMKRHKNNECKRL